MKKIIILKGKDNTGKTTKILEIANWIKDNYSIQTNIDLDDIDNRKDINGVISVNKLSIGFNSSGDNEWEVKKIKKLKANDIDYPDIIICSCRTRGKGYRFLENTFTTNKDWLKIYINVKDLSTKESRKKRDNRIIEKVKALITGLEKI